MIVRIPKERAETKKDRDVAPPQHLRHWHRRQVDVVAAKHPELRQRIAHDARRRSYSRQYQAAKQRNQLCVPDRRLPMAKESRQGNALPINELRH